MTCFSCLFRRSEASPLNQSVTVDEGKEISGIDNVRAYSYKDLRIATDDFSPDNKIGQGGFGSVYKGSLGGMLVAVKVLSAESRQGVREFLTEIKVISDIKHENLVKLHGCCVEGRHRILVYGYVENNSLAKTLLGDNPNKIQFSWKMRSQICIGIARGLAYLHEEIQPHIVHRDIKASNILLDKDFIPKIADFGLAKLVPEDMTHVSTRVAGTIGYMAPEYAVRGHLTRKADIYSFGVLILEIVSGRSNTNNSLPYGEKYLLERAWELHECGELEMLVDPSLSGDYDMKEVCRFLKIGLLCTQEMPKLRPHVSNILKKLMGEIEVDDETITKPGIIPDFMDLKIKSLKGKANVKETLGETSNRTLSQEDSSSMLSYGSITFTAISKRD